MDAIYHIFIALFLIFLIYCLIFIIFRFNKIINSRIRILFRSLGRDSSATISKLMHSDSHLTEWEKRVVYDNLELDEKFELALKCFTARMKTVRSMLDAVAVFTSQRMLIIPCLKNLELPFIEIFYSDIKNAVFKKGFISDKIKIKTDKSRICIIFDKSWPAVNESIIEFINHKKSK